MRHIHIPGKLGKFFNKRISKWIAIPLMIIIGLPLIEYVVLGLVFGVLFYVLDAVEDLLPPGVPMSYTGLFILMGISLAVILVQYFFSKKKSVKKLYHRILSIFCIELVIYFWYVAWFYYVRDSFENFGGSSTEYYLYHILDYIQALYKTVAVSCIYFIMMRGVNSSCGEKTRG